METESGTDHFDADDPEAVKLMIDSFYHSDYETVPIIISVKEANEGVEGIARPSSNNYHHGRSQPNKKSKTMLMPTGDCNTLMHTKLYALREKYGIASLKKVRLAKLTVAVTYAWNHSDFIFTIKLVFTSTPEHDSGPRDLVSQAILDHEHTLSNKRSKKLSKASRAWRTRCGREPLKFHKC